MIFKKFRYNIGDYVLLTVPGAAGTLSAYHSKPIIIHGKVVNQKIEKFLNWTFIRPYKKSHKIYYIQYNEAHYTIATYEKYIKRKLTEEEIKEFKFKSDINKYKL